MKKSLAFLSLAAGITLLFAGCAKDYFITHRFPSDRAELTQDPIAVPPAPIINPDPSGTKLPGVLEPVVHGTWTFTTPTTTTRVNHETETYAQYSIYWGRPAPTDKPFVVITVGEAGDSLPDVNVTNERDYVLNENIAHERVGHTADGSAFCEITLHRPDNTGSTCTATAVARNEEQRKLALQILSSITWKANN